MTNDNVTFNPFIGGIYDMCNLVAPNYADCIVDLGARHGEGYTLFGINKHPSKYYFVEPSPRCITKVQQLIEFEKNPALVLIPGILTKTVSEVDFFLFETDHDQSGNAFSKRNNQYGDADLVKVQTFDYRTLFNHIDFVKCNIEGGEYQLIDDGFFDIVDSFVMEAHNQHVPGRSYVDILDKLSNQFELEVWGNVSYKYCYINGKKKT